MYTVFGIISIAAFCAAIYVVVREFMGYIREIREM